MTYSATCACGEHVTSKWMLLMPIKTIWHDWAVHRLLFTDAWNPLKNAMRIYNTIKANHTVEE